MAPKSQSSSLALLVQLKNVQISASCRFSSGAIYYLCVLGSSQNATEPRRCSVEAPFDQKLFCLVGNKSNQKYFSLDCCDLYSLFIHWLYYYFERLRGSKCAFVPTLTALDLSAPRSEETHAN